MAIQFPPEIYGYTNVYEGHTQGTEPALGAGCNSSPSNQDWIGGDELLQLTINQNATQLLPIPMCQ